MPTLEQSTETSSVSRILRVSARIGEDYYTIEETVVLPIGASEADIAEAVALGERIYKAQQQATFAQLLTLRAAVPAPPARRPTARQLKAVYVLQGKVGIPTVAALYRELGIEAPEPQTFDDASALIDRLQATLDGRAPSPETGQTANGTQPEPPPPTDEDLPF